MDRYILRRFFCLVLVFSAVFQIPMTLAQNALTQPIVTEEVSAYFFSSAFKEQVEHSALMPDRHKAAFWDYVHDRLVMDHFAYNGQDADAAVKKETQGALIERYATYYRDFVQGKPLLVEGAYRTLYKPNASADRAVNGPCTNMDFENNVTGWTGSWGTAYNPNNPTANPGFNQGALNAVTGKHTMMTGGMDPWVNTIPRVYPGGGGMSIRLGDQLAGSTNKNGSERITQTFLVTATNTNFTYHYAVLLNDGGHSAGQQPYFRIRMLDKNGAEISCARLDVNASNASTIGFSSKLITNPNNGKSETLLYKDWTTVVIPLLSYMGQNVTIEFTTSDCNLSNGSHFAYAYIDAECSPFKLIYTDQTICSGKTGTIPLPDGYEGFSQSSVAWTSIFPGAAGAYNSYLSCKNGCFTPTVTPGATPPAYVDYRVCAKPASNCVTSNLCDTVRVYFNPPVAVTINPVTPVICAGQTSATLTANVTGGTAPYTYLWNNANPSQSITVGVGTYNVQVTDAKGCQPALASSTVTSYTVPIVANAGADQIKCSQSPITTVNASVSGAAGGIWSGGLGTYSPNNTTLNNLNYNPTAAELSAGFVDLILTTTGNGNCPSDKDTVRLTFKPFQGSVTATPSPVKCFGGNTGSATASITGGSAPYTFSWSTVPSQTNITAINLTQGTYTVRITDAIGCTFTTTTSVTQPAVLATNATPTAALCNGDANGSVSTATSGGTTPYTYSWSPTGGTAANASSLSAGSYTVNVTDVNGCVASANAVITQPATLNATLTPSPVNCFGGNNGSITSTVTGGTTPYTYSWSPSGGAGANATGLTAGTYTLTVRDAKGCVFTQTTIVAQPTAITTSVVSTNESCDYLNNGTAAVTVSGGTAAYTYSWSPVVANVASLTGLAAGTYTCTVTDAKGCIKVATATITQPATLTATLTSKTDAACFGSATGGAVVTSSGGTPGYTYAWSPSGGSSSVASNLPAAAYTVNITDSKGCATQQTLTIAQPTPLALNTTVTKITCNGANNGAIAENVTGGTTPYKYLWSPVGQTTATATGLGAGTYTLTVTDINGCTIVRSVTLTQPNVLATTLSATHVSCMNGTDGAASSVTTGGTLPYTYSWNPVGGSAANASNLTAGTYALTVKDSNNCVTTQSVIITQPSALALSTTAVNESCDYLNNGSAQVTASGGTPGYQYTWMPGGQVTSTISSLAAGTYTVTVKDAKGCSMQQTAIVTEPDPLVVSILNNAPVNCFGGNDGSISAGVTGGTPNYTYTWSPSGGNGSTAGNLSAGTYTLNVSDSKGCLIQKTQVVTQPSAPLTINPTITNATCFAKANGSVTTNATGGTTPYTYAWSNGAGDVPTIANVKAGTYSLTLTDANACSVSGVYTITQPAQIVINADSVNSTCGFLNGSATASVSGGVTPYTYNWSTGATTSSITAVKSGVYGIRITDANGCISDTVAIINDLSAPTTQVSITSNVTCYGAANGSATAAVNGGNPPFVYTWAPSGGNSLVANNLAPGTYTFTVTDKFGCISSFITSNPITEPNPLQLSFTKTAVSCFGGANATATATANGGTPPYTYTWLPGNLTGASQSNLAAGTYTVNVTDAHNCQYVQTVSITQPSAPLAVTTTGTDVSCFGGSDGTTSATVTGGTTPYYYNWMPGNIQSAGAGSLIAGSYTVFVTDKNGCAASATQQINQPTALSIGTSSVTSKCSASNGQATVNVNGGTVSYTYSWSPYGGTSQVATNLMSGTYTVYVKDAKGCAIQSSVAVLDEAAPTASITSVTNISCFGGNNGSATVTASGGKLPYTYSWSPQGGTASTASGLIVGQYTVVVTDANNCSVSASTTTPLTQPVLFNLSVAIDTITCFGANNGKAKAIAGGGTPSYSYSWSPLNVSLDSVSGLQPGISYTLNASDANGCEAQQVFTVKEATQLVANISTIKHVSCKSGSDGAAQVVASGGTKPYSYQWTSNGGNGDQAIGLAAGSYTVTVTDANGCSTQAQVFLTEPANRLDAVATVNAVKCFGTNTGSVSIATSGGTAGYTYQWLPSGGNAAVASALAAGNYTTKITDSKGCDTTLAITVTEPAELQAQVTILDASCEKANGQILVQPSGGTLPYVYTYNSVPSNSNVLNNANPGAYTIVVRDSNLCSVSFTKSILNQKSPDVTLVSTKQVSCFGGTNGSATVALNGGKQPVVIQWLPYGGTAATAVNLNAGTYTAVVTDSLGCKDSVTTTIGEPSEILIAVPTVTPVKCKGNADGAITVQVTGGTPAYTYSWAPSGGVNASAYNLAANTYTVNVTDKNNCQAKLSMQVLQPDTLKLDIANTTPPACNGLTGSVTVNVTGGNSPYQYSWSTTPVQTASTASGLLAGTYTVSITDDLGCRVVKTTSVIQPQKVQNVAGLNDTICLGGEATLTAMAQGGNGTYKYAWQPLGVVNNGILKTQPTTNTKYTVVAYDQNGCASNPDTVDAIVYTLNAASLNLLGVSPLCPGQGSTLDVQTYGNTGPLTYTWNQNLGNTAGPMFVTPSQTTTYKVTVTNYCGQSVSDSITIDITPQPTLALSSDTTVVCAPGKIQFFDNSVPGSPNDPITFWEWNFGDSILSFEQNPTFTFPSPGTYTVTLKVYTSGGCTANNDSTGYQVQVLPVPTAGFTVNKNDFELPYDILKCTNTSTGAVSYTWSFGDGGTSTQKDPQYAFTKVGTFQIELVAISSNGCKDTATVPVNTHADMTFPTAFTPDPDGSSNGDYNNGSLSNNVFFPYTAGVEKFHIEIFNRWGEMIFVSDDVNKGWNGFYLGKLCQQDAYVWKVDATFNNGRKVNLIGNVTLLQ